MQSGKAFLKNTVWYLIPFLIMTVIAMFSLSYTFGMLQDQNHEIIQTQLGRGMEEVEEQLFISRQLALEISMDSTLSQAEMLNYEGVTAEGIDRLLSYKQRMEVCSSLFIAYKPEKFITAQGSMSRTVFCRDEFNLTEESEAKITEMMQAKRDSSSILEGASGSRYVFILYYFPESRYVMERWVGFTVKDTAIAKRLQNVLGNMDSVFLLTYGNEILAEMNKLYKELADEELADLYQKLCGGDTQIPGYTVMTEQGKVLDLQLFVALSNGTYMKALAETQMRMFGMAIASFGFMSLFLWFYGRYQYKKAQAIQLLAVNMHPDLAHKKIRGEYEFIQKVLEKDFEQLKHHDQMLNYFRKESKKQLTWLLLKSTLPEEIQIEELMENYGMEATGSYYVVLEFLLPKEEYKADFLDDMSQVLMYQLDKCDAGTLLMVVASLESRDETHTERFMLSEKILQELSVAGYLCKGVTCGLVYENLSEIHSSQEEAFSLITLLDKEKSQTKNKIVFFDEATQMSKRVPHITADLLQQFKECLQQEKCKEAVALLDALLAPPKEMAQELLTYSRYKIIQIMANEWKVKGTSTEKMDSCLILMNLEGDAFKEEVKKCIHLFCVSEEPAAVEVDIEQILSFISEHAWDSQLSMNLITDSLGISERTVRRIMKEKMNKTYKEYITEIRLGKACELLEHTNLDVQTIVTQVGYYNVPSFNRLFKLAYGVSPGEYRVKNRQNM